MVNEGVLGPFRHFLLNYAIDTSIFKPHLTRQTNDTVVFGFLAENLDNHRKGVDLLLRAIDLGEFDSNVEFVCAGNIGKLELPTKIKHVGFIDSENEMSHFMNELDCFIIPSREDNLPNTVIESLCCGVPVIGFDVGGIGEMIQNEENGLLINEISSTELLFRIRSFVSMRNSFDRSLIARNAHLKYNIAHVVKSYLDIIKA
jgi:glycosyltransferase involved in cell wall biosynthesis